MFGRSKSCGFNIISREHVNTLARLKPVELMAGTYQVDMTHVHGYTYHKLLG